MKYWLVGMVLICWNVALLLALFGPGSGSWGRKRWGWKDE